MPNTLCRETKQHTDTNPQLYALIKRVRVTKQKSRIHACVRYVTAAPFENKIIYQYTNQHTHAHTQKRFGAWPRASQSKPRRPLSLDRKPLSVLHHLVSKETNPFSRRPASVFSRAQPATDSQTTKPRGEGSPLLRLNTLSYIPSHSNSQPVAVHSTSSLSPSLHSLAPLSHRQKIPCKRAAGPVVGLSLGRLYSWREAPAATQHQHNPKRFV